MNQRAVRDDMTDAVLVDVLDELTARFNAGESFDLAEYERRLPEHVDQIRKLAATLEAMAQFSQSPPATEKPENAPKQLGDFRIVREIGRGGMGVVYEAEQISLGRPVALKVLPYAALMDERAIQRFRNEARAVALLDHPNIVPVHAVSVERGVHFYAMSLISGLTLAEVIAEMRSRIREIDRADLSVQHIVTDGSDGKAFDSSKPSGYEPTLDRSTASSWDEQPDADIAFDSPCQVVTRREMQAAISTHRSDFHAEYFRKAATMGIEAAEALDHAHQAGIIHRDIKPGNLMIDTNGKTWITDFGLARISTDAGMTATGDLIGTIRYMAPEQALAKRVTVDHSADIYSLGVTLYELLTLQPAFDAPDREALLKQIAFEEPRTPRRLNQAIPRELEIIVQKAMAKHPNERFETAQELADDLRRFLVDEPIHAIPPTLVQRATCWSRRHRPLVASAMVILLLTTIGLAIGNILIAQQRNRAEAATTEAEKQTQIARENFERARDAVDQYLTKVSQDRLLKTPGMQPLRKDLLELALKYYQEFITERRNDPKLQADLAAAYDRVGIISAQIGKSERAIEAYRKSCEVLQGLVAKEPTNAAYDDMSWTWMRMSLLLMSIGDMDEAEHTLQKAIGIRERLVEENPSIHGYQLRLADAYLQLGQLQMRTGRMDLATASCEKASKLSQILAEAHPDDGVYLALLGRTSNHLGMLLARQGQHEKTLVQRKQSLAVAERVAPRSATLAGAHHNLGNTHWAMKNWDDAVSCYQKAIKISEGLVADNPAVVLNRQFLANHYGMLGYVQSRCGKNDEALASSQKGLDVLQKLATENPNVGEYQESLIVGHANRGVMQRGMARHDAAFSSFESAIAIGEQPVAKSMDSADLRRSLGVSHAGLSRFWCTRPDPQRRQPEQALKHAMRAVELAPSIGELWWVLGMAQYRHGQWEEAIEALTKSIETGDGGGACDWLFLAMAHWQLDQKEDARRWYDKATQWMNENESNDEELVRFRQEAAELLGIEATRSLKEKPEGQIDSDADKKEKKLTHSDGTK